MKEGERRGGERHYPPVLTLDPTSLSSYHYGVLMNLVATNSLPHAQPLQNHSSNSETQRGRGDTQANTNILLLSHTDT